MTGTQLLADRLRQHLLARSRCGADQALRDELLALPMSFDQGVPAASAVEALSRLAAVRPTDMSQATLIGLAKAFWQRCTEELPVAPQGDDTPSAPEGTSLSAPRVDASDDGPSTLVVLTEETTGVAAAGTTESFRASVVQRLSRPLPIGGLPESDCLEPLRSRFPWFDAASEEVARRLRFAHRLGARRLVLPPLLLIGPPGIGKTQYAAELAAALGRSAFAQPMAGLSDPFPIAGIHPSFQSAQPSLPVRAFLETGRADPVVVLDEIDKTGGSNHHGSPLDALLPLLEQATASHFRDAFIDRTVNASEVFVIATANPAAALPPPLNSRFVRVLSDGPVAGHLPEIVKTFRHSFGRQWGVTPDQLQAETAIMMQSLANQLRRSPDLRAMQRLWQRGLESLMMSDNDARGDEGERC